jgi:hypothetical protein
MAGFSGPTRTKFPLGVFAPMTIAVSAGLLLAVTVTLRPRRFFIPAECSTVEYPGWAGGSYEAQAFSACFTRTVNLYVEFIEDPGGTAKRCLLPTPGVEVIATRSTGSGRAHMAQGGREFAVIGTGFVEISEDGTITEHGVVALDSSPATISSNGDAGGELFITAGSNGYLFTLATNTFATIAALAGIATMGDYLEGYFLALNAATGRLYASELNDGATWNTGSSFAERSLASDPWVSMKVAGRNLWLMGSYTSEAWYNRGSSPFAFEPHPSGLIQHGCAAAFSPAVIDGALAWLAASRIGTAYVVKTAGFSPEVISTQPLQNTLSEYSTTAISGAIGDAYNDRGHTFYLLSFPSEITHAYDNSTNLWCERGTWVSEDNEYTAWRPRYHVMAFGEHRWLDADTGDIYRSDADLTTDVDDRPIRRMRRPPAIVDENKRVAYHDLEVLMDVGLGAQTGQGSNPQVMFRISRDGGRTWGAEVWRGAGGTGEYSKRVRLNRLGSARQLVVEMAVSDPIAWRFTTAYVTAERERRGRAA